MKCDCDVNVVKIQEYQRSVAILVPDFITLKMNNPEQTIRESVCIDACLVSEILELWRKGIVTTGCCCGHNQGLAYIGVEDEFIPKMKELGYEVVQNGGREDSFYPKSLKKSLKNNHIIEEIKFELNRFFWVVIFPSAFFLILFGIAALTDKWAHS